VELLNFLFYSTNHKNVLLCLNLLLRKFVPYLHFEQELVKKDEGCGQKWRLIVYWLRFFFVKNHSFKSIVVSVFWRIKPRRNKSSDIDGCPNFPHHFFYHLHEKMKFTTNLNLAKTLLCNVLPWNFVISNCDDGTKNSKNFLNPCWNAIDEPTNFGM
jgi:hypothetical protein